MRRWLAAVVVGAAVATSPIPAVAQSVAERSPNLIGVWSVERWRLGFAFAHRFEFLEGGNQLINYPTLSLALGLPLDLTAGLDYTSNSEVIPASRFGNETQFWLKRPFHFGPHGVAALLGYNNAAESIDGALFGRYRLGPLALLGELRGFSDRFGSGEGGVAGAAGLVVHLTPYLALGGDFGRMLMSDAPPGAWSAGASVTIPGTPHTFSLHAANSGATTLQSVSRNKVTGVRSVRYGFVFTVPLGTGSQWLRIFRPAPPSPGPSPDPDLVRVDMRQIEFSPRQIRIRAGQTVEWINSDPVVHTVTADDQSWGSELLQEGERYERRFTEPGRYPYVCLPHPMMTGVVIVEP
jgi:hypothetical protein